jgi:SdrD B-like domain
LISGAVNYNNVNLEPGRNLDNNATASQTALTGTEDWYTQVYYRPTPGGLDKADYRFADGVSTSTFYGDTTSGAIWGGPVGSSYKSGDGVMANNGSYTSILLNYFNGVVDIPVGFISCSTVDNANVTVAPLPGHPTRGALNFSYGAQLADQSAAIAVEYGVGGLGGTGTTWLSDNDMKISTCENSDSTGGIWYNDITAVPGGPGNITKVRFRLTDTYTVAEQLALMAATGVPNAYSYGAVHLKVKSSTPAGEVAPNYGKFKDPSGNWFNGWSQSTYDSANGLGYYGDRITVVGTRVRIAKTINDPTTESASGLAGNTKTFYLTPTSDSLGINPPGQSVNVKIVDTIPVGLTYTQNTSVCVDALPAVQPTSCEPGVVINNDGTTTLTWDFGTFTAGAAMTKIKFDVTLDSTVADGQSLINSVAISADNDNSALAWRTDTATAVVVNPSAFAVQKKVLTPFVPIGNPISYKLIEKNTGSNPVATTDFIDWLPWNGDARTPASNIDGQMKFTSLTHTAGVAPSQIRYTKHNPTTLSLPADLDPNTINPAIVWCAALSGGACPANNDEVTGFRFETGIMAANQGTEFVLVLTPSPTSLDKTGNIFTNRFKGRVDGLTLPIESNNVFATVSSGTIGDTIYWDKSGNGLQDAGEKGIPGITVVLLNTDNSPVDCDLYTSGMQACTAVTDADGKYIFKDLLFGDYKVKVTQPSGYTQTGDPDSTINNESILSVSNTSPATRSNLTGDFGYKGNASFGDKVWEDRNGNGTQDTNELPIQNAEVTLLFAGFDGIFGNADDVIIGNVNTDSNGNYLFTDLPAGNYRATLNTASVPGLTPTTPTVINQTLAVNQAYTTLLLVTQFTMM